MNDKGAVALTIENREAAALFYNKPAREARRRLF